MAITSLLRESLQIPRHPEGARVSEVVEGVGENGDAPRIEPTEELNDSEEKVEQEGHEDIPLSVMVMVMVMMMVPVAMAVSVTMSVVMVVAVAIAVAVFVRAHIIVFVLVFVGLH